MEDVVAVVVGDVVVEVVEYVVMVVEGVLMALVELVVAVVVAVVEGVVEDVELVVDLVELVSVSVGYSTGPYLGINVDGSVGVVIGEWLSWHFQRNATFFSCRYNSLPGRN